MVAFRRLLAAAILHVASTWRQCPMVAFLLLFSTPSFTPPLSLRITAPKLTKDTLAALLDKFLDVLRHLFGASAVVSRPQIDGKDITDDESGRTGELEPMSSSLVVFPGPSR